jgi:C-terminal processing protease CtpA/Prc
MRNNEASKRSFSLATRLFIILFAVLIAFLVPQLLFGQSLDNERERGREMLKVIKSDLKKNYYDPDLRGYDLEVQFREADEKLKQASSLGQVFGIIAQTLLNLDDSHTFFSPPSRSFRTDYGWQMLMIGDTCFVVAVKPGSDAQGKGLKQGDVIQSIDGFQPSRSNLWKIHYAYYTLRPKPGMRLMVARTGTNPFQLDVMATVPPKDSKTTSGRSSENLRMKAVCIVTGTMNPEKI